MKFNQKNANIPFMRFFWNIFFFLSVTTILTFVYYIRIFPNISINEHIRVKPLKTNLIRGKYLVNHLAACTSCHSTRDWNRFSAPVIPKTEGIGGDTASEVGLPNIVAKNITPFNLDFWIDGEVIRAITSGINYDNKIIHPYMPYKYYNHLTKNDLYAIVSYVRSLSEKISPKYKSEISFYNKMKHKIIPKRYTPPAKINYSNKIERGKYLTTIASCSRCHTMDEKKSFDKFMAGGKNFFLKTGGQVLAANITPDVTTGIGSWSEEQFLEKFKSYSNLAKITSNEFNSVMPWYAYNGLSNNDLSAIYSYLMTLKPISNEVKKFIPDAL